LVLHGVVSFCSLESIHCLYTCLKFPHHFNILQAIKIDPSAAGDIDSDERFSSVDLSK